MSDWDAEEVESRPTVVGLASVVLGTLTLLGQPFACCLSVFATIPLFAVGVTGLMMGMAAYRNAIANNYRGFELSIVGITLGAVNITGSMLWCGLSSFFGGIWLLSLMA